MEKITLSKDALEVLLFHSYVSGFQCGCNPFAQDKWKDRAELTINALIIDAKNSESI